MAEGSQSLVGRLLARSADSAATSRRARNTLPKIFISYRRSDSASIVGRLYERLVARYTQDSVFRDIDSIPIAKNFYDQVRAELSTCDAVLVIIGPRWLARTEDGRLRIQNIGDPVRIELEAALNSGAAVIPVMVEDGVIPDADDLPESVRQLPSLAGTTIDSGKDFDHHMAALIGSLDNILSLRGKFVAKFPAWAKRVAVALGVAAAITAAAVVALPLLGMTLTAVTAALVVTLIGLTAGGACGLACGAAAAKRRVPLIALQKRPTTFAIASACLTLVATLLAGVAAEPFLRSSDPVYLAHQLRVVFPKENAAAKRGHIDFSGSNKLLDALHRIDPRNGYTFYFAGEIKRASAGGAFQGGCFVGWPDQAAPRSSDLSAYQQDFNHYREVAQTLLEAEGGGNSSWDICYERANGYCRQRTAWIYHLLANDFYVLSLTAPAGDRKWMLEEAQNFAKEARKFVRREGDGARGFTQCTADLYNKIDAGLKASTARGEAAAGVR